MEWNNYYYFTKVIPEQICQLIYNEGMQKELERGTVYASEQEGYVKQQKGKQDLNKS